MKITQLIHRLRNITLFSLLQVFFITSNAYSYEAKGVNGGLPRTVFVQLFEWTWKDIARECEIYLGPAGFAGVQISPPQEHIEWGDKSTPWWERYQPVSYKIESRSGNEQEFIDMVQRCQKVGVDIYADIVINHMAGVSDGYGFTGGYFKHFEYPGIYGFNDFHHCGRNGNNHIKNYNDIYELQNCMLVNLADLKTESYYVQTKIAEYLNHLLDLGVKGFRVDAAKHIPASDLRAIFRKLKKSPYIFQELILNGEPLNAQDYIEVGDITAYGYPFKIGHAFNQRQLGHLLQIAQGFPRSEDAIVFVDNHDIQRVREDSSLVGSMREQTTYRLAQIFMLTWPYGYPQIFSGYSFQSYDEGPPVDSNLRTLPILNAQGDCQGPWMCEHRLPEIPGLIYFRNYTNDQFYINNWWSNGSDQIAFERGTKGFVIINSGNGQLQKNFKTNLPTGYYKNLVTMKEIYKVDDKGILQVNIGPRSAVVLLFSPNSVAYRNMGE